MDFETFHHEADVGIRGYGATPALAFTQAALALTAVVTPPDRVVCRQRVEIQCHAPDLETLFVDWINALIYEMATRKLLFCDFTVSIEENRLVAEACGEVVDWERHDPAVEVKGATYTELRVAQLKDGRWIAQCVVDV